MKKPVVKAEKMKKQRNSPEMIKKDAEKAKALSRIESIENDIKEIDLAMAADKIDYEELSKLYSRKQDLSKELDSVMNLCLSFSD